MLSRIFNFVILIPIAVILIALSVANRQSVPVSIDVFNPGSPALTFNAPLFVWLFSAIAIGIVIGGVGTWFTQRHHRKREREFKRESDKLRHEIEDTRRQAKIEKSTPGQALVMKPQS